MPMYAIYSRILVAALLTILWSHSFARDPAMTPMDEFAIKLHRKGEEQLKRLNAVSPENGLDTIAADEIPRQVREALQMELQITDPSPEIAYGDLNRDGISDFATLING